MSDVDPLTIALTVIFWSSFAALFLCACCIIRCSMRWDRLHSPLARERAERAEFGPQKNDTLHRKLIRQFKNSLKTLKTISSQTEEVGGCREGCAICFDEYTGPPSQVFIGYIKKCGHYFHFDCIWKWLEVRGSCPMCREKVKLKEGDIRGLALSQVTASNGITASCSTQTDSGRPHAAQTQTTGGQRCPPAAGTRTTPACEEGGERNSGFENSDTLYYITTKL